MEKFKYLIIMGVFVFGLISPCYGLVGDELMDLIDQEKEGLRQAYNVCHDDSVLMRQAAISFKANLQETARDKKCMVMQLNGEEISRLERFGFKITSATTWIQRRKKVLDKLKERFSQQQPRIMATAPENTITAAAAESIPGYSCYETVEGTFAVAQNIADTHPDLASWIDIGDSWEKGNGVGGFDMMVLKLTNSAVSGSKPILFINSAIHAREYTTTPLVLNFARYLVNQYGIDADATWILDYNEIHMLLYTNPDGRKYAESGLSWRKNTNQNYCRFFTNYRGADLNRNFTFAWHNSEEGSSGSQCNAEYRGPYAASEPETQAMEAYVRSIYPDRRGTAPDDAAPDDTSGIHLDIHSYGELILWPWGSTANVAPNGTQMQTLGRKFAYWNGYLPQQSIGLYPTDGTTEGISYGELGVPNFTFELGTAFFEDCTTYHQTIVPNNMPALIYAAKVARSPYVTPAGPNTEDVNLSPATVMSGDPVTLTATASDARFNNSNGTEPTQAISAAEYYVDTPPWEAGAAPISMNASDGYFNSSTEAVTAVIDTTGWELGKYTIFVRSKDTDNVWGAVSAEFLTITEEGGSIPSEDFYYENTTQVSIPDRSSISSTINVPEDAPDVATVTISVTTTHADLGDLSIVASKDGRSVTIKTRSYWDNSSGTATYTATVDSGDFSSFTGTWTLTVTDNYRGDVGALDSWNISE